MLCSGKEIKSYKLLEENFPPSPPIKDAKLYVLNSATNTIKVYITDLKGIPRELSGIETEINDLSNSVTWANVPDVNITQSSIVQHEGALTIQESQIVGLNYFSGDYEDLLNLPDLDSLTYLKIGDNTSDLLNDGEDGINPFITANDVDESKWEIVNTSPLNNVGVGTLRIPTETEWNDERLSWDTNNAAGAFGSLLKLTTGGNRNNSSGSLFSVGTEGYYWSSTVSSTNVRSIFFSSNFASTSFSINRALGFSIRLVLNGTFTQQEFNDNYLGETIAIENLDYGYVYNPTTNKIWLDRNLGATQVATSSADADAYGWLYQWGRLTDGHQIRTSTTTSTLSLTDVPLTDEFITSSSSPFDWRSPQNDNLWQSIQKLIGKNGLKADYEDLLNKPVISTITTTSQLTNDGEDGINPFITALDIPPDAVSSVNTQTGSVVLDADDISDIATLNKYTNQSDIDRLSNTSGVNTGDQTLPTNTSDLINDGEDGINPFITDLDIPPPLTFDTIPTSGSTNPVTSQGIKTYVDTNSLSSPGSDGQVLYNNGGTIGGSGLYYDDVNGRVGIGTTSPSAYLHIRPQSNEQVPIFKITGYDNDGNTEPVIYIEDENSNVDFTLYPNTGGFFRALKVDSLQINNGPVSIGQSHSFPGTQTKPLNVVQADASSQLRLLSTTDVASGKNISGIEFYADTVSSSQNHTLGNFYAESEGYISGVSYPTSFVFALAGTNENSPTERVRITGDGNVGIGTASPSQALTVQGSISASGAIHDNAGSPGTPGQVIQSTGTGYNWTSAITASSLQISGGVGDEGTFTWNPTDNTVDLRLNNTTLQLGQELHYHVINQTGTTINNGEVVYVLGVSSDKLSIAPYNSSLEVDPELVLGIATENILNTQKGFVTKFGSVRGLDTSAFTVGTSLYASTGSSGYTDLPPLPPNYDIFLGVVTSQSATEGSILVNVNHVYNASEIQTNLSGSNLISTNVQAALLELDGVKANVSDLSSNIVLYPTTGSSAIAGYLQMVTSKDDVRYNTTPENVSTGIISGSNQLIAELTTDPNIFVGNPGTINLTTVGNIRKTLGSGTASFYFELYQRLNNGAEILISTSNNTLEITSTLYTQFDASALLDNGSWLDTDRIVIKYYGTRIPGAADPTYEFQFGGDTPVRTLLPVPISVIPSDSASDILVDTSTFNNILDGNDSNVQEALETLDDHSHTLQEVTDEGSITTNRIILGDITVDTDALHTSGSRVGIGTTNPSEKLHISQTQAGGTTTLLVENPDTTNQFTTSKLALVTGNNSASISATSGFYGTGYLSIENEGLERIRINAIGAVGIGTTIPQAQLDVSGAIKLSEYPSTTDTDKFAVLDNGLIKYRTGTEVLSDIGAQASLTNPITGTGTTNYLPKFTGTTLLGDSLIFDNGTNVGIGTANPSEKLGIVGKISLNNGGGSVFVGEGAGLNDGGANYGNVGIGYRSLYLNTTGFQNTANGYNSLYSNTQGLNNTANGNSSLFSNTTGFQNTAIGFLSGRYADISTPNETGLNSVFIGYNTKANANGQTNQIVIGASATGIGSNTVTLGNDTIVTTALKGNIGVGTTSPSEKLDVVGNIKINNSLHSNTENLNVDSGTPVLISSISNTDYTAGFFDYVIKKGTNLRAGTITSVHDGINIEFMEVSTVDLGSTTDVDLSVTMQSTTFSLIATTQSDDWEIKVITRAI